MTTKLLTIFTRTPLHVGAGSSVGAVDQPIVRERHTGYPVIPGSSIKGVLADLWLDWSDQENPKRDSDGIKLLGAESGDAKAGSLLIGEGKLLAFPVRSAKGGYALITCPLVLNRFKRDCSGFSANVPQDLVDGDVRLTSQSDLSFDGKNVIFESYVFQATSTSDSAVDTIANAFVNIMPNDPVWVNVINRLAIVSDGVFKQFVEGTCEIANHNRIEDKTGVVVGTALFSQENVPSETMFYSVLNSQEPRDFEKLAAKLTTEKNLLQIGADMTTGLGWCSVGLV